MDQEEFRRRIRVYLELDQPELDGADQVATNLADRLFRYVQQPPAADCSDGPTLRALLGEARVLLFFSAAWDGSAPGYREVVGRVADASDIRVVDIDIDDCVGSAVARLHAVMSTPCVVDSAAPSRRAIGRRTAEQLAALLQA